MPRVRKHCPYPGCHAKHLVRLANHLVQVHNIEDRVERHKFLKEAQISNADQLMRDLIRIVHILSTSHFKELSQDR